MPIDASIYQNVGKFPSLNEYDEQANRLQQNKLALMTSQQQYAQGQQTMADQNALRTAAQGFGDDQTQNYRSILKTGNVKAAQDYLKSSLDNQKTQADTKLSGSHAANFDSEVVGRQLDQSIKAHDFHLQELGGITPDQVPKWINDGVQSGVFTAEQGQAGMARFQQAASQPGFDFNAWRQQGLQAGTTATEQLKMTQAKLIADQSNATSVSNNDTTNKTHLQAAGIAASTSRANNAANIGKDYAIAGMSADGTPSANVESMAQMIAAGKAPPIGGFALARPQGQAVMARVAAINPAFDATDYAAKNKAAKDFASGPQGNAMRSFNVAGQHLDQLSTLADALGNGNMQIINTIGNKFAEQTGGTAPTDFDAAKDVVSKEVVKAIVAGGGGVSEREELSRLMSNAKSPAQLKGVITQYRNLMGAQHDALLQQRRAAGLADSTLPNYSGSPATTSSVPADIQAILDKHGTK